MAQITFKAVGSATCPQIPRSWVESAYGRSAAGSGAIVTIEQIFRNSIVSDPIPARNATRAVYGPVANRERAQAKTIPAVTTGMVVEEL
ncbi:hypothetical protein [Nocardia africana]